MRKSPETINIDESEAQSNKTGEPAAPARLDQLIGSDQLKNYQPNISAIKLDTKVTL